MLLSELIVLARLLIRYSMFVELIPSEQRQELEMAIDVLLDAQRMIDRADEQAKVADLPF